MAGEAEADYAYVVKEGDSLGTIAVRFDTTPGRLMRDNRLLVDSVFPGQVLFVRPPPHYVKGSGRCCDRLVGGRMMGLIGLLNWVIKNVRCFRVACCVRRCGGGRNGGAPCSL